MILCDTGPLIALIDETDPDHKKCLAAVATMPPIPLLMTWACLTEAMYLSFRDGGWRGQEKVWRYFETKTVVIHESSDIELDRMRELMRRYADTPMDFADASVVAAAEATGIRRVFTLDQHFFAYRIHSHTPFAVVP